LDSSFLAQAGFRLGRAFGWTPRQVRELTAAQAAMYLQMLDEETEIGDNR